MGQKRERPGVIARFVEDIICGRQNRIISDGRQTRGFILVDDMADAFVFAPAAAKPTYTIASGRSTPVNGLPGLVADACGYSPKVMRGCNTDWEPGYSAAGIALAKSGSGLGPKSDSGKSLPG